MTKEEIIGIVNQVSKEWLKEFPTPEETANQVPKRFLEIFAKLVAEKEREECAKMCEYYEDYAKGNDNYHATLIRARRQE